jgi:SAM-dependent methyltransferase/uncharacterized protein YbaR (Trm112 family)
MTPQAKRARLEEAIFPLLCCVRCAGTSLELRARAIACNQCAQIFPIHDSIPLMTTDPDVAFHWREESITSNHYSAQWIEQIGRAADGWVLDLASGNNPDTHERVIKYDIFAVPNVDVVGRAEFLPFADKTFRNVISGAAFEHFQDPFRAIEHVFRVLCDGGEVYIETAFLQPVHAFPDHYYNMTLHGLERLCSAFERMDSGVRPHQAPSFMLRWILQGWADKLPHAERNAFLNTTVAEIIGEYERDPFSQRWMAAFSRADVAEMAAGVYFHGRKRPR